MTMTVDETTSKFDASELQASMQQAEVAGLRHKVTTLEANARPTLERLSAVETQLEIALARALKVELDLEHAQKEVADGRSARHVLAKTISERDKYFLKLESAEARIRDLEDVVCTLSRGLDDTVQASDAVLAEREACARACDLEAEAWLEDGRTGRSEVAEHCARSIRNRGTR